MKNSLIVPFTERTTDELKGIIDSLNIVGVVNIAKESDVENKEIMVNLLTVILDLFSVDLPEANGKSEEVMKLVSRDIAMGKWFRERGLFRFFKLLKTTVNDRPFWSYYSNPETLETFSSRDEFIGWFCSAAKVPRSLIFQRMATIERLFEVGFDEEHAYELLQTYPSAVTESARSLVEWTPKTNTIESINPVVVAQLANRYDREQYDGLVSLARHAVDNPEKTEELVKEVKPLIKKALEELGQAERARDAVSWIKNDMLLQPEITYVWDTELDTLVIIYSPREMNLQTGEVIEHPTVKIPLVPDIKDHWPLEVKKDIIKRLPVTNKAYLDK